MLYELKNCRNGESAPYKSTVDISEKDGKLRFFFTAEHSSFYCPFDKYNEIHSAGDACEVLIGTDPDRRFYYEIEISAKGDLMLALMENTGLDENGNPVALCNFIDDCWLETKVEKYKDGYTAEVIFDKERVMTHGDKIFFNAYRIETDGGENDKHLIALSPTFVPKFHMPAYFKWLDDYTK
jgi:hypothetical protein